MLAIQISLLGINVLTILDLRQDFREPLDDTEEVQSKIEGTESRKL